MVVNCVVVRFCRRAPTCTRKYLIPLVPHPSLSKTGLQKKTNVTIEEKASQKKSRFLMLGKCAGVKYFTNIMSGPMKHNGETIVRCGQKLPTSGMEINYVMFNSNHHF